MECRRCPAYGIDDLRFHGCLVRHTMEDLPNGKDGCHRWTKTILKEIEHVKENKPVSKYYKWINQGD